MIGLSITLGLEWDFEPLVAVIYYVPCNAILMLRFLLRVCDELPNAVGPVVRSGNRSGLGKVRANLQRFLIPVNDGVRKRSTKTKVEATLTLTRRSG